MDDLELGRVQQLQAPTVTEQVFDLLYDQIVTLKLEPGTRISEAEIGRRLDVSRQPVRDAFFRLSKLGLLSIRPQRSTTVASIRPDAVAQALFLRTAIEVEALRAAMAADDPTLGPDLRDNLARQRKAADARDKAVFHALDDAFHARIFAASANAFAWTIVRENKAHMDRVRYISLEFGAEAAYEDHAAIIEEIAAQDLDAAAARMRCHLDRILGVLAEAQRTTPHLFE